MKLQRYMIVITDKNNGCDHIVRFVAEDVDNPGMFNVYPCSEYDAFKFTNKENAMVVLTSFRDYLEKEGSVAKVVECF